MGTRTPCALVLGPNGVYPGYLRAKGPRLGGHLGPVVACSMICQTPATTGRVRLGCWTWRDNWTAQAAPSATLSSASCRKPSITAITADSFAEVRWGSQSARTDFTGSGRPGPGGPRRLSLLPVHVLWSGAAQPSFRQLGRDEDQALVQPRQ